VQLDDVLIEEDATEDEGAAGLSCWSGLKKGLAFGPD